MADFFCGCGGTSAGLRAAGFEIALGLDFDAEAAVTFQRNFPEARFVDADIRDVPPTRVKKLLPQDDKPLLISACAPCQPFSSYRKKSKSARRNRTLLASLLPFIKTLEPDYLLVENVPGIEGSANGPFAVFRRGVEKLGYELTWDVVDCQFFGIPQRRRRFVALGSLHGSIELPVETHGPGRELVKTVWDAIGDLPPLEAGETDPVDDNHRSGAIGDLNLRRLQASRKGRGRLDWPRELWLDCHRRHGGHSDVYGCMDPDRPAPVLTTKCTSISNGRFGHPSQDRAISVREAACLQTFPRDFRFVGGLKSTTRQVGNAVPVLLAERLGATIASHAEELGSAKQ